MKLETESKINCFPMVLMKLIQIPNYWCQAEIDDFYSYDETGKKVLNLMMPYLWSDPSGENMHMARIRNSTNLDKLAELIQQGRVYRITRMEFHDETSQKVKFKRVEEV